MAYVVTDSCIQCKYTDCVAVCPVDCFYQGPNFLVIHPDECIDCGACEPECPTEAIFEELEVPPDMEQFIALNRDLSGANEDYQGDVWPVITEQQDPLADADQWQDKKNKRQYLQK